MCVSCFYFPISPFRCSDVRLYELCLFDWVDDLKSILVPQIRAEAFSYSNHSFTLTSAMVQPMPGDIFGTDLDVELVGILKAFVEVFDEHYNVVKKALLDVQV